jgi:hypothetical protein
MARERGEESQRQGAADVEMGSEGARLEAELQRERERVLNGEAERRARAALIGELEQFNEALLRGIAARDGIIAERDREVERLRDAQARIAARLREVEAERDRVHGRLAAIEASTTWKLGHPVRRTFEKAPGLRRWARRAAKAAWWAATGQIGHRLAEWRASRKPEAASPAPQSQPQTLPAPTPRERAGLDESGEAGALSLRSGSRDRQPRGTGPLSGRG